MPKDFVTLQAAKPSAGDTDDDDEDEEDGEAADMENFVDSGLLDADDPVCEATVCSV